MDSYSFKSSEEGYKLIDNKVGISLLVSKDGKKRSIGLIYTKKPEVLPIKLSYSPGNSNDNAKNETYRSRAQEIAKVVRGLLEKDEYNGKGKVTVELTSLLCDLDRLEVLCSRMQKGS